MASRIRVLIVDDHAVVRKGVRLMLADAEDMEVAGEAETAEQALQWLRAAETPSLAEDALPCDVVLVDIALPGQNGLELLRTLHAERPALAVLVLSTYAEDVYAIRAMKLGAAGYLTKDAPQERLMAAIRRAASGARYLSPALTEQLADMVGKRTITAHAALSNRELQVMRLIAAGESLVGIAGQLHLSPHTVTTYRTRILEKTGLRSNAELTRYALEHGLLL